MSRAKKCRDHLGNEFESKRAMCRYYGVTWDTFKSRLRSGFSLEQALTGEGLRGVSNPKKACKDHLGNEFDSESAMCRYWGVELSTYRGRRSRGVSIEDSLTCGRVIVDHLGNKFISTAKMCEYWGVKLGTYRTRRNRGYTIERCLTGGKCEDHLGNKFRSIEEMCRHWGVGRSMYDLRIKKGFSLKEALTTPDRSTIVCEDHLGNRYPSIGAMCECWGVDQTTFNTRRRRGYSLEECLSSEVRVKMKKSCVDHLGNVFRSMTDMCNHWGISLTVFDWRMKHGMSLEEALTKPVEDNRRK